MSFHVPESARLTTGKMGSTVEAGNNGVFLLERRTPPFKKISIIQCIASDGGDWEHVSVTVRRPHKAPSRCPSWDEMAAVKSLFWDPDDCVVQFHPPESEYIDNHPYCLHLWRPLHYEIHTPPAIMVGL